ncbi:DUF4434 family protein [Metapseudomonas resinovorans]|uniref:DUF4434 family protein n=1 Tax=Metapseudomonas resinovorans TaxID=53412 RepID=UPI000429C5B6|nr:DUF4434 family protein [Pseudomonas resinovorans]MDE3739920.1 DUF4434 family protein [Pseudomonas resinovorans]
MRGLLLALCLLLGAQLQAEERLFYQPLNADSRIALDTWRDLWRASARNGVKTLIVQWTAYGDSDFGGANGWLAQALRAAHEQGLHLVLGLYMDPAYYQRQRELDNPGLAAYWQYQLGRSLAQQRALREQWLLPASGWYLPLELEDQQFQAPERREALRRQLQDFHTRLGGPLHLSAFSAGKLAPSTYAGWLGELNGLGIQVWWQDGEGTVALPSRVRRAYAVALPCSIGIVREAFRQTSKPDQPFHAVSADPARVSTCHPDAVFSLRYRPWGKALR